MVLVLRASPFQVGQHGKNVSLSFNSRFSEELTKMVSLYIHISHFLIELLSVLLFFLIVTSNCLHILQFTGSDADMV